MKAVAALLGSKQQITKTGQHHNDGRQHRKIALLFELLFFPRRCLWGSVGLVPSAGRKLAASFGSSTIA